MPFNQSALLRSTLFALASISASALASPAFAQAAKSTNDAVSQTGQPSSAMGELIVTARKREETILNVPVIEAAIPKEQLERRQTMDLKDVSAIVPDLSLSQTLGVSGLQVSLRGVGTSAQNAGIDASVALNIDGLQITQGIAYTSAIFDLGQIEVLEGPQALFYGKNSPGGVISLRSADPTDKFEAIGSYGYEVDAAENRAQAIISGPVSDKLKLRLATQYDTQEGYFQNNAVAAPGLGGVTPTDRSGPGDKSYVIRGTAIWQPSDQFDARLKVDFTNDTLTGGVGEEVTSCPTGAGPVPPRNIPFLGETVCGASQINNIVNLDPNAFKGLLYNSGLNSETTNQKYGTLELNYRPRPDLTLTSVTGYYHLAFHQQEGTYSSDAGPGLASIVDPFTRHDVTEELRANSDFSGPLNFSAGGYYQNANLHNRESLLGNTDVGLPATLGNYLEVVPIKSISGFGQLRYKVIPAVEIEGGVRYTHETRELTVTNYNFITGAPVPFPTSVPNIASNNASPEATVTYKPTDDITTFASFKEGYKSGSFSLSQPSGVDPNMSFNEEKVEGWEAGAKAELLDRSLYTNLSFYDYHYKGLQVGVSAVATNGVPVAKTLNAGGALIYGSEFDVNYLPPQVEGLRLHESAAWNHARFKTLNGVPCWGGQTIAEGCNQVLNPNTGFFTAQQNLAGLPLLRAPDWQVNFGFDYERPIGHDLTLGFSSATQYSSSYLTDLGLRSDFYQSSFVKTDATVELKGPRDRWEFALIGKNLGDVLTTGGCVNSNTQNGSVLGGEITGGTGQGPAGVDVLSCYLDRGREVWLRLTVKPFN